MWFLQSFSLSRCVCVCVIYGYPLLHARTHRDIYITSQWFFSCSIVIIYFLITDEQIYTEQRIIHGGGHSPTKRYFPCARFCFYPVSPAASMVTDLHWMKNNRRSVRWLLSVGIPLYSFTCWGFCTLLMCLFHETNSPRAVSGLLAFFNPLGCGAIFYHWRCVLSFINIFIDVHAHVIYNFTRLLFFAFVPGLQW